MQQDSEFTDFGGEAVTTKQRMFTLRLTMEEAQMLSTAALCGMATISLERTDVEGAPSEVLENLRRIQTSTKMIGLLDQIKRPEIAGALAKKMSAFQGTLMKAGGE